MSFFFYLFVGGGEGECYAGGEARLVFELHEV